MFDLTNPDTIQSLLKKHNFAPNKFLGQNFLIDEKVLEKIIATANIKEGDNVIEIGPGLGVLTEALLAKGANVVAIEKDKDLIPVLEENLKEFKSLKIINDDFLEVDLEKLLLGHSMSKSNLDIECPSKYKVVSNIPYYITSPVLRKILTAETRPEEIVFLVQREVAERISAEPGQMSVISVFVQFYGTPSVVEIVKPESFWPAPKVESAILKIVVNKDSKVLSKQSTLLRPAFTKVSADKQGSEGFPPLFLRQAASKEGEKSFWRLVKIGFSSRRKTLANNLAAGLRLKPTEVRESLKTLGFSDKTRAQELGMEDWLKMREKFIN
ncbi:MAG: 16S rRNA (adenine(1518)-N(6)/adenine(1519)-N(6))-dimethyltransferase RsmA [bacterium]|nr:16S rRNA (adenine(1518)-N(6)/adenine(1519)-N(6))-dimethyltransferase RsmA [bacterium]